MKGKNDDQLERNLKRSTTACAAFVLTPEEQSIVLALRDPEKANALYALMQHANALKHQFERAKS